VLRRLVISQAPDHLLFIEPGPATPEPVIDELTKKLAAAWLGHDVGHVGHRYTHKCACGARSDNRDHYVRASDGKRLKTNSLAIHYLAFHREQIPAAELAKLDLLPAAEGNPTRTQLRGNRDTL
jgi:hypothetical protein